MRNEGQCKFKALSEDEQVTLQNSVLTVSRNLVFNVLKINMNSDKLTNFSVPILFQIVSVVCFSTN